MKRISKKILAYLMAAVMAVGLCQAGGATVADAATATLQVNKLGNVGTVTYNSHTKTGTWWKFKVGSKVAFCQSLGKTAHSGVSYTSETTYNWDQDTSGDNGLKAKLYYWFDSVKNRSKPARKMTQALDWAIEDGMTSESELKSVIRQMINNGVFPNQTAASLYSGIFETTDSFTVTATKWKKASGSTKAWQVMMTVDSEPLEYKSLSESIRYRQRVTVTKTDEDGNALGGIPFTLYTEDEETIDRLYSFSVYDRDGTESSDDIDEDVEFSMTGYTTDAGRIGFRMTYQAGSDEYYYVPDDELEDYTAAQKQAVRDELDELGYSYPNNLTKASAQEMAEEELEEELGSVKCVYYLQEDGTGDYDTVVIDEDYASPGKKIVLDADDTWTKNSDGDWPDMLETYSLNYSLAYQAGVTNNLKKYSVPVVKTVSNTDDGSAHGDSSLKGAVYQLYTDQACTKEATAYTSAGKETDALYTTDANGAFRTDYLKAGVTYYMREISAPEGQYLSDTVTAIYQSGEDLTEEYTDIAKAVYSVSVTDTEYKGRIQIWKVTTDGSTGEAAWEEGAEFEIYLTSKGSYDACGDDERAVLTIGPGGSATSGLLAYGTYTIHQTKTGNGDTAKIDDQQITVCTDMASNLSENSLANPTYSVLYNNKPYEAYLRVVKVDGETEKTVLKSGTSYLLYEVDDAGNENQVIQEYSNGNKWVTIGTTDNPYTTDETGTVMTVSPLTSGTYRLYEITSAEGLYISKSYIEVEINSQASNLETETITLPDGSTQTIVTVYYVNNETAGKLAIKKTGEVLTGWDETNSGFVYEERSLKGAVFEIRAEEDIITQDGQGDTWFKAGDLVATLTTGEGAVFEKTCSGLCTQSVDSDGIVHITLPLGAYTIRETDAPYGYVVSDKEWSIAFNWENSTEETVIDSTGTTDGDGLLSILDDRAKPELTLLKSDADTEEPIEGAVFGLYTTDAIYNADGEKILSAGSLVTTATTDGEGKIVSDIDVPLMSEGYDVAAKAEATAAVSGSAAAVIEAAYPFNSGNYYWKEISVSDSYYLNTDTHDVHLEYKGPGTKSIALESTVTEKQTTAIISKQTLTGTDELEGAEISITDAGGNEILSWVSKKEGSVWINRNADELGYRNLSASFNDEGRLLVNGLLHGAEYTMTETKPADGYATAESITFKLEESESETGVTVVYIKSIVSADSSDLVVVWTVADGQTVVMQDDTTKVDIIKTDITGGEEIPGCELEVTDQDGNVIDSWTSTEEPHRIEKLTVGETYTLTETKPADGYTTATDVEFTIADTGEVQSCEMSDDTTKIRFEKLAGNRKGLAGAKIKVTDSDGQKVMVFKTKKKGVLIEGTLKAGETYTFTETKAPDGYEIAPAITFTVKDTGEVQAIKMTDAGIGRILTKTPEDFGEDSDSSPQTGYLWLFLLLLGGMVCGGAGSMYSVRRYHEKK